MYWISDKTRHRHLVRQRQPLRSTNPINERQHTDYRAMTIAKERKN